MTLQSQNFAASLAFGLTALITAQQVRADVLKHIIEDRSSAESMQTQGACSGFHKSTSHHCNPAAFSLNAKEGMSIDLLLKAEQDAYETMTNLIFEPVKKQYLESLFAKNDFLNYSSSARIEIYYGSYLALSYTPIHIVAALKSSNPSLPEFSFAGMKQSVYRLTTGKSYENVSIFRRLNLGVSVFHFDRDFYAAEPNILELAVKDASEIISTTNEINSDFDFGIMSAYKYPYLPEISLKIENATRKQESSESGIEIKPHFKRKSSLSLSKSMYGLYGRTGISINFPFWGLFKTFDRLQTSVGINYRIGHLSAYTAYSAYADSFGFVFSSELYRLGIQYSNEKQHNRLDFERKNNVYLYNSYIL